MDKRINENGFWLPAQDISAFELYRRVEQLVDWEHLSCFGEGKDHWARALVVGFVEQIAASPVRICWRINAARHLRQFVLGTQQRVSRGQEFAEDFLHCSVPRLADEFSRVANAAELGQLTGRPWSRRAWEDYLRQLGRGAQQATETLLGQYQMHWGLDVGDVSAEPLQPTNPAPHYARTLFASRFAGDDAHAAVCAQFARKEPGIHTESDDRAVVETVRLAENLRNAGMETGFRGYIRGADLALDWPSNSTASGWNVFAVSHVMVTGWFGHCLSLGNDDAGKQRLRNRFSAVKQREIHAEFDRITHAIRRLGIAADIKFLVNEDSGAVRVTQIDRLAASTQLAVDAYD